MDTSLCMLLNCLGYLLTCETNLKRFLAVRSCSSTSLKLLWSTLKLLIHGMKLYCLQERVVPVPVSYYCTTYLLTLVMLVPLLLFQNFEVVFMYVDNHVYICIKSLK